MQKRLLFLFALLVMFASILSAQVTTSALGGKVTLSGSNEPLIGASVQVVHEPSGTRYATVTNIDGRYEIQGMRTGGPYSVTVSYVGHKSKTYTGIMLQLGEVYKLSPALSEDANELGEVVVTGKASKFSLEKTGATTNISNAQMTALPTINRSISDIARISPYANGMSFAVAMDVRPTSPSTVPTSTTTSVSRRHSPEEAILSQWMPSTRYRW